MLGCAQKCVSISIHYLRSVVHFIMQMPEAVLKSAAPLIFE
jgi:hypothetical protein